MIYNMTKVLPRNALTKFSASCKLFFLFLSLFLFSFFHILYFVVETHTYHLWEGGWGGGAGGEEKVWTRCNRSIKSLTVELRRCQRPIQTFKCNGRRPPLYLRGTSSCGKPKIELSSSCVFWICRYMSEWALKRPHTQGDISAALGALNGARSVGLFCGVAVADVSRLLSIYFILVTVDFLRHCCEVEVILIFVYIFSV